jgi:phosphoglycerate dehydrogenase-like enzyme
MTSEMGVTRRWRVLVPTNLYDQQIVDMYESAPDLELHYALPEAERVFGGGPLGPYEQRRRVEAVLWDRIGEFDVVGAMAGAPFVTAPLLDRAPDLKIVFIASAGTDSIDVAAATRRGIVVVNAAGNNVVPVAEHTMGLLLALSRKIAYADRIAHREKRSLHVSDLGPFPGVLRGKTLGLVGFGRIGREVARIASAGFGMQVLAHDPVPDPDTAARLGVELVPCLDQLLAGADVVSVHIPLTADNRHRIGRRELALMKPGAFLLNTSRGAVVDTDALVEALRSDRLAGAGLDVTDPEPLPDDHPLHSIETVVLTGHAAGVAPEVVIDAHRMAAQSVIDARRGVRPSTLVNPEAWPAYLARLER